MRRRLRANKLKILLSREDKIKAKLGAERAAGPDRKSRVVFVSKHLIIKDTGARSGGESPALTNVARPVRTMSALRPAFRVRDRTSWP